MKKFNDFKWIVSSLACVLLGLVVIYTHFAPKTESLSNETLSKSSRPKVLNIQKNIPSPPSSGSISPPIHYPKLSAIQEELKQGLDIHHEAPLAYRQFVREVSEKMELAKSNPHQIKPLFNELKNCMKEAEMKSAQAFCLWGLRTLAEMENSLQNEYAAVHSGASSVVKDLMSIVEAF